MKTRKTDKLAFITLGTPGQSVANISILANSLHTFGGELSECPIWLLVPEIQNKFSAAELDQIKDSNVNIISYDISPDLIEFPFASKVFAAAEAEKILKKSTELLVWLDDDSIILQEPKQFLLPSSKKFGYRPVHHKLIGISWGQEINNYWEHIYNVFDVPLENTFPMTTHTGEQIYPYFNAGTFVIRPEMTLLNKWKNEFVHYYRDKFFRDAYQEDFIHAIFFHQVIFTGVMLNSLKQHEMNELSPRINYPLHLHGEIPKQLRSANINELITVRYEDIFKNNWENDLPINEPILSWVKDQLNTII